MPDKSQFCQNCYFFFETGQNEEGKIGYCRRDPPHSHTDKDGVARIARFPIVLSSLWCGEWDPATPEEIESKRQK